MAQSITFIKRLIEAFLSGFAIATGVSFIIVPLSSRMIFFKQTTGFIALMKKTLRANDTYVKSLRPIHTVDPSSESDSVPNESDEKNVKSPEITPQAARASLSQEAQATKDALHGLGELFGKMHVELGFAKKEVAYGKLNAEDLGEMFIMLRNILLPVVGMSTFIDILQAVKERRDNDPSRGEQLTYDAMRKLESDEWGEILKFSYEPFKILSEAMQEGLDHILYTLELVKRPEAGSKHDVEMAGDTSKPGEDGFKAYLQKKINHFHNHREETLRLWCGQKGVHLPDTFFSDPSVPSPAHTADNGHHRRNQHQLYLILYVSTVGNPHSRLQLNL